MGKSNDVGVILKVNEQEQEFPGKKTKKIISQANPNHKLGMVDFEKEWKIEEQITNMRQSFHKRLLNNSSYV